MQLYEYRQNNSGGSFDKEPGLKVYVEAASSLEANAIAKTCGVYFDGVEKGHDCACCGDRWYENYYERDCRPTVSEFEALVEYAKDWNVGVSIKPYNQPLRSMTKGDCKDA